MTVAPDEGQNVKRSAIANVLIIALVGWSVVSAPCEAEDVSGKSKIQKTEDHSGKSDAQNSERERQHLLAKKLFASTISRICTMFEHCDAEPDPDRHYVDLLKFLKEGLAARDLPPVAEYRLKKAIENLESVNKMMTEAQDGKQQPADLSGSVETEDRYRSRVLQQSNMSAREEAVREFFGWGGERLSPENLIDIEKIKPLEDRSTRDLLKHKNERGKDSEVGS